MDDKPLSFNSSSPLSCKISSPKTTQVVATKAARGTNKRTLRPPQNAIPDTAGTPLIQAGLTSWINYGLYKGLSSATLATRKLVIGKLIWWLESTKTPTCDRGAIMGWIAYLRPAHAAGRWGNTEKTKEARPQTVATYFSIARALFNFMISEGMVAKSPCAELQAPKANQDQIKPFSDSDVFALLKAAKTTKTSLRDTAIVALLCETAIRVSELTNIRRCDLDLAQHQVTVLGKGNKRRTVPFGLETKQALTRLLTRERPEDDAYLFLTSSGKEVGQPMTRSGVYQLLERLGKQAHVEGVRCSPHTCRHYAAVTYIGEGADAFFVQSLLGHSSPRQTARYVNLGQAAMAVKARKHSPLDNLKKKKRQGEIQ